MFALVDCNNFYASCERLFRPELNGKPIVVLSNNDGAVIARSNEAKALGVPMGALAFEYESFFLKNNIHVFSANFALYGDMSHRVMSILQEYSPECEIYSIDEAFLKLTGFEMFDLNKYGAEIQLRVRKHTGIPICIGIAPTKSLAKVANKIAKKYPKELKNSYVIDTNEKLLKAIKWLSIEDVWGIGRKHSQRLRDVNVKTAYEFTLLTDSWIRRNLSVVELRLKHDLQGKPTLDLEDIKPKKNIATTRSFERNLKEQAEIQERITTFAVSCAEKLRRQNACCTAIHVFLKTNSHREELEQYNASTVVKLPFPTNSSIEIAKFACKGFQKIFRLGYQYKKAGVIIMDFKPETEIQLNLFENSNPKHRKLMHVIDQLNNSFGQQKIKLASQDQKRVWKMKQERLSPRYTTQLSDIIIIKA
jgi:DNA polymerase V